MSARWIWCLPFLFTACGSNPAPIEKPTRPQPFDWPQWQGPHRTNVSDETGLLKQWPAAGPALLWKAKGLGEGFSTPSVAGGRIYVMGNRGGKEYVIALDEDNGRQLWATATGRVRNGGGGYPGPRCTPTVDGDRVYALGLNGDLVCLDVSLGQERWRKDLAADFGGRPGNWGYSESPLIDGEKLVCTPGGPTATLVALNKLTGATVWQCPVPSGEPAAYASAVTADVGGQRQYVQFLSRGVGGVSAADGQFLWRYDRPANGTANCSTPVFHDNQVFAASGYGTGGGLARLTRKGDETRAQQVYDTRSMKNHHGGFVLVNGCVYGANDPNQLVCLDFATGQVKWDHRAGKGSIAYADGRLYYRDQDVPMLLIEASPGGYVEKGRFDQSDRSSQPAWPHPVIANGRLYLRDQDVLLCYDVQDKQ
jgi:outer membrane protein assembly factor BamB